MRPRKAKDEAQEAQDEAQDGEDEAQDGQDEAQDGQDEARDAQNGQNEVQDDEDEAPEGPARLRPVRPPLPPTSLIPCLEDATFDAVLLFFGSCFELGDLSSEGRVLGAPVVPCNLDF